MIKNAPLAGGTAHRLPADLKAALQMNASALDGWRTLTPLARNEWICWIISPKRTATRRQHVRRAVIDLASGKRRPCCWLGCVHRTDKPLSASQKYILKRQAG